MARYRSSNRSSSNGKFACGILFGSLVGGVAALLFAPKSGDKLRKELKKKYNDVSDKTCDLIDGVCDQTNDLIERAKDIACDAKAAASKLYRRD